MAITIAQIEALPEYTPGNLLTTIDLAIVNVCAGNQSYSINGRTFQRPPLKDLLDARSQIKSEVDAAASSSGRNTTLADFSGQ